MEFDLNVLVRNNIKVMQPYSSARDEFNGTAKIFLDANENSLGSPIGNQYNRYPDPYQLAVKEAISLQKNIPVENIFLGNGSDECIDLLYRCFCNPGRDNVIICPPTYGMYEVSGNVNDVEVRKAVLLDNFQLEINAIKSLVDRNSKMIWICSPNNPTGNSINPDDILYLLNTFNGLVIIDEAYIDFSTSVSFLAILNNYPNLVVLQTLSKAWGLAALRLGMAFASPEIIAVLNKVKAPYNISGSNQTLVLEALHKADKIKSNVKELIELKLALHKELIKLPVIERIYHSDANFLLAKVKEPLKVYEHLIAEGIVVRNRSNIICCEGCLRITIGSSKENISLIDALNNYKNN